MFNLRNGKWAHIIMKSVTFETFHQPWEGGTRSSYFTPPTLILTPSPPNPSYVDLVTLC